MLKRSGLIWKNLANSQCPQCGEFIKRQDFDDYSCSKCHFFCRKLKAREIILDIQFHEEQKYRDKIADDFLNQVV